MRRAEAPGGTPADHRHEPARPVDGSDSADSLLQRRGVTGEQHPVVDAPLGQLWGTEGLYAAVAHRAMVEIPLYAIIQKSRSK